MSVIRPIFLSTKKKPLDHHSAFILFLFYLSIDEGSFFLLLLRREMCPLPRIEFRLLRPNGQILIYYPTWVFSSVLFSFIIIVVDSLVDVHFHCHSEFNFIYLFIFLFDLLQKFGRQ